jgi:bifunctional non-homologous end joining protein LigD
VIAAAQELRAALQGRGLASFVKTSGGKGLHVVVPIAPRADWDAAKAFTQNVAETLSRAHPDRYVATMSKRAREGRIFIDYVRNGRGATAVSAYSTRARPGAPVSTPLTWEELSEGLRSDHFTVDNLRERLDFLRRDPWEGFFELRQEIGG